MKTSTDRILTTHAGSLPRPEDLTRMMWDLLDNKPVDKKVLDARIKGAVQEVVNRQRQAGVDVISDGEMSKVGFSNYAMQRFSGFGGLTQFAATDIGNFPTIINKLFVTDEGGKHIVMRCIEGPIELKDPNAVLKDIANFKAALGGGDPDDAFIPAVTPGQMLFNFPNRYYKTDDDYLEAAARALRYEYEQIIKAGFNLQLDAPDLPMRAHCFTGGVGVADMKTYVPKSIEAMNLAIKGLPTNKIRLHLCWGNYAGPHHHDIELQKIIKPILKIKADFIYFEAANPRHAHEWEVWKETRIPDDKILIPGAIDTLTNHVEHPRLVAQRLEQFARIAGKERVIGGTDCGFGTFVGWSGTDPEIAWLKLSVLAEGARIASQNLWKKKKRKSAVKKKSQQKQSKRKK
jgi:5-methyltetrahydropteroyltriglutamate--homocysteine methyltransferase